MLHPGSAGLIVLALLAGGIVRLERVTSERTTAPARIDTLAWLAGCWERTGADRRVDEQWMAPDGGMMMGMSRTVRGGRATGWESLRIYERDEHLVYAAQPSGQPPAEFVSTMVAADSVSFENPAHDFPQRIRYRLAGDSLFARIEGNTASGARAIDFPFVRGECGTRRDADGG